MNAATVHMRFSWSFAVAYFALVEVVWELHEQAHIQVGRLLCGAYGERDFNVWSLTHGCKDAQPLAVLAPLAGPLFSFAVCYAGWFLLRGGARLRRRGLGLALMLAPIPFARLIEAALNRGDEITFLHRVFAGAPADTLRLAAVLALGGLCVPLVLAAWRALEGSARVRWILGMAFLPLPLVFVLKLVLLDALLRAGWLAAPLALGTPGLVWLYFACMGALLAWRFRSLSGAPRRLSQAAPHAAAAGQK